ncbi:MAG: PrgI family protein [Lachnospiraceae bacterium]|nr:PrgI family protein [Lachnospiraceae bacterium]
MASYISIPRDLSKVKTKVFFNLTKRQLVCFGSGAAAGLPVFFVLRHFGVDIGSAVMGMMVVMIPFFLFAMFEKNGQPLEKILKQIIQAKFKRPKIRPYKTNNYYACLLRQADAEKEAEKVADKG